MMATRLGVRIERLRKRHDLTQEQLAVKVSVSQQYIALLEKGDRKPSFDTLKRLAKALDVSLDDLAQT